MSTNTDDISHLPDHEQARLHLESAAYGLREVINTLTAGQTHPVVEEVVTELAAIEKRVLEMLAGRSEPPKGKANG